MWEEVGKPCSRRSIGLSGDPASRARKRVQDMCEKLLANTVIEEYRVEEIR